MRCEFQKRLTNWSDLAPFIHLWRVFHHPFPRRGMGMAGMDGETVERVGG